MGFNHSGSRWELRRSVWRNRFLLEDKTFDSDEKNNHILPPLPVILNQSIDPTLLTSIRADDRLSETHHRWSICILTSRWRRSCYATVPSSRFTVQNNKRLQCATIGFQGVATTTHSLSHSHLHALSASSHHGIQTRPNPNQTLPILSDKINSPTHNVYLIHDTIYQLPRTRPSPSRRLGFVEVQERRSYLSGLPSCSTWRESTWRADDKKVRAMPRHMTTHRDWWYIKKIGSVDHEVFRHYPQQWVFISLTRTSKSMTANQDCTRIIPQTITNKQTEFFRHTKCAPTTWPPSPTA